MWATLGLVVLTTAVVRLRLLDVPLDRDEGEYAYFGQLLLQGVPPYATAYNLKLPGGYGAYAVVLWVFGQSPAGVHLGLLVANAAATVLLFALAARMLNATVGVAAAAAFAGLSLSPRLYGLGGYAEHFVLLPALAGALVLVWSAESRRLAGFLASGALLGLAFVVKQSGGAFVLFGVVYTLLRSALPVAGGSWPSRLAPTIVLLAGAMLPYAALCLLLAWAGVFASFWFWTAVYASQYGSALTLADGITLFFGRAAEILATSWALAALAAVGVTALFWDAEARRRRDSVLPAPRPRGGALRRRRRRRPRPPVRGRAAGSPTRARRGARAGAARAPRLGRARDPLRDAARACRARPLRPEPVP